MWTISQKEKKSIYCGFGKLGITNYESCLENANIFWICGQNLEPGISFPNKSFENMNIV